jgi:hypothetical protein
MRRLLAFAMLVVALSALPSAAEDAGDNAGGWKAVKKRPKPVAAEGSLAYRPSTQYEPPVAPPKVVRTAEVKQAQFTEPANSNEAPQKAITPSVSTRAIARRAAVTPPANGKSNAVVEGTIARARNGKNQSGYVLLNDGGDPEYILAPNPRQDLAPHVGRHVRIRGMAVRSSQQGRLSRLSIGGMTALAPINSQGSGEILPVTLLQVPSNAETPTSAAAGPTLVAAGQEEVAAEAAPTIEDVPPPRKVERMQPSSNGTESGTKVQIMPEEIHAEQGAMDGEVYYAPDAFGESEGGEIIVEGAPMAAAPYGRYGRPYPRGPIRGLLSTIDGAWVRADYLLWSTEGMNLPPLVTTSPSGTPRSMAGVLGEDGTSVLFGDETVFDDTRSGGRIRGGVWFDPCHVWGLEGEYLALEDANVSYRAASPGDPILARPFFDPVAGQETSQLVAFPALINGEIEVDAQTQFNSYGVRLRLNAANQTFCCDPCEGGGMGYWDEEWSSSGLPGADYDFNRASYRLDLLGGYRYLRLDDQLRIHEDLTSLDTTTPGTFDITDNFETENRFNGGEIGLLFEVQRRRWSLELLTKIAIGTTQKVVTINGSTTSDENGDVVTDPGGLLAQRTNMGTHEFDEFSAVPELGIALGYQLTRHTRLTVGYTLIYWSSVARAGDQIDLDVNPNLIPPEVVPFAGPERPEFTLVESDFWAHGLTAGVDIRW